MRNKGFTLIEVLAVIVVIGLIAVITVPIVKDSLEDSKKNLAKDSAYGYKNAVEKIYFDKAFNGNRSNLDGLYLVGNDGNLSKSDNSVIVDVSGNKPKSGYLVMNNNEVSYGCLVIGKYEVNLSGGEVTTVNKGICSVKADFSNDSWDRIITNLTLDRNSYDDQLGKEKYISMDIDGNGVNEQYKVRLANTTTLTVCSTTGFSQTACGVVIEFVDVIGNYAMNSTDTNVGGWPQSEMFDYLNTGNSSIYSKLPSDLKNIIVDTYMVTGHGSTQDEANSEVTSKLYLFSTRELGNGFSEDTGVDLTITRTLDNYEDYSFNTNSFKNKCKRYDASGNVVSWWLRTPYSSSSIGFIFIGASGSYDATGAHHSKGVAPAFRIME